MRNLAFHRAYISLWEVGRIYFLYLRVEGLTGAVPRHVTTSFDVTLLSLAPQHRVAQFRLRICSVLEQFSSLPSGHYLYLETSYPARRGYKAHLRSKTFVATEGRCLSWWYNMNGYSIGALNVYKAKGHHKELVWTRSRHQGKAWLHGSVLITSKTKFQVQSALAWGRGRTDRGTVKSFKEGRSGGREWRKGRREGYISPTYLPTHQRSHLRLFTYLPLFLPSPESHSLSTL